MSPSPTAGPNAGVTAVIATRNRPELLAKAVDAVLAQDYDGPIEVIAVFDQAEPVGDLERSGTHRSVRVTTNARTPGLPGARNTGIALGTHPLVAFCDDDDLWLPAKLRAQTAAMQAAGAGASVTGIRIHYGDKVRHRSLATPLLRHADLVRDRVTAAHPSSYLVERSVVDAAGPVDETIPGGYAEDYDWLLRVARHTDIACVTEPMVEVLWHPGSFFTRRWDTIDEALTYLLDKHPEIADDPHGAARIHGQQAFSLAARGMRSQAWSQWRTTVRGNPLERRALATLVVLSGVMSADRVLHVANRFGRGI
ncbi:glycosyltransferase family 2 protein [Nocardioides sp. MAHUQ-72]|uniref:glycosyltransferase family 2 protein n=1 Tax=unclassified Nocardioides TaxID=2615069 RepID=UPI003605CCBA